MYQIKNKIGTRQLIKVASFHKHVRKTDPHKHSSYFEIVFLTKGGGFHTIDMHEIQVEPPQLFFIRKDQVHHWDLTSEPEGYVLIIKDDFVNSNLDSELQQLLEELSSFTFLTATDTPSLIQLFDLMIKEKEITPLSSSPVVNGLLKALLGKFLDSAEDHRQERVPIAKADLYGSFLNCLREDKSIRNSVKFYAEKLNTTPQNLNAVCRKNSGRTAAEVIAEFIIREAKRLLVYTSHSISEIAFSLQFKDVSHFVKYFKRYTAMTPLTYRKTSGNTT